MDIVRSLWAILSRTNVWWAHARVGGLQFLRFLQTPRNVSVVSRCPWESRTYVRVVFKGFPAISSTCRLLYFSFEAPGDLGRKVQKDFKGSLTFSIKKSWLMPGPHKLVPASPSSLSLGCPTHYLPLSSAALSPSLKASLPFSALCPEMSTKRPQIFH